MGRNGLLRGIRKHFIKRAARQWKEEDSFDITSAERYELPADASGDMGSSHSLFGFSFENDEMFYVRRGLRGGDLDNEVWLVYRDRAGKIFVQENDYVPKNAGLPVKVEIVEAGKVIRFSYDGFVFPAVEKGGGYVADTTAKPVPFVLEAEFKWITKPVEFLECLSPSAVADAFCDEPKSNLLGFKDILQVQYYQTGKLKGYITIGGKTIGFTDLNAVRDRAYGTCDRGFFDRYIRTVVVLENGDVYNTCLTRYPILKELKSGFAAVKGRRTSLSSSTSMDSLPAMGNVPKSFVLKTRYEDKSAREINCKTNTVVPYLLKDNFLICGGFSDFTVNNVKGKGIIEFGFNADKTRWDAR